MKRCILEKFLRRRTAVVFYDGDRITGTLKKTYKGNENPNFNFDGYYYLEGDVHHTVFRCSYVKTAEEL